MLDGMSGRGQAFGVAALVATGLLVGCPAAELGLNVDLKTDLAPGTEFTAVRTELFRESPGSASTADSRRDVPALRTDDFAGGQRAAEFPVGTGDYWVRVRLLAGDAHVVAERVASVHVAASLGLTVLITRSCAAITCPAAETCVGGACVDPACVGVACTRECAFSAECATMATCASAECIDGVCFYAPRPGGCAAGEWCNPAVGCVRDTSVPDAGPPRDAGPDVGFDAGGRDAGTTPCVPSCPAGSCGDDGCGHACASPDCSGRACGPDPVCGTDCGSCGGGTYCAGGACVCGAIGEGCSGSAPCCGGLTCPIATCCRPLNASCTDGTECCGGTGTVCSDGECCIPLRQFCAMGTDCCPGRNCVDNVCCMAVNDTGCGLDDQCCGYYSANVGCRSGRCCWTAGHGCTASSAGNCCDGTCSGGIC